MADALEHGAVPLSQASKTMRLERPLFFMRNVLAPESLRMELVVSESGADWFPIGGRRTPRDDHPSRDDMTLKSAPRSRRMSRSTRPKLVASAAAFAAAITYAIVLLLVPQVLDWAFEQGGKAPLLVAVVGAAVTIGTFLAVEKLASTRR